MIKAECDRCGAQVQTERAAVKVAAGLLTRIEIPIPEGWQRVAFPLPDAKPEEQRKELCPKCVNALLGFLEGDGKVPGLLEPETLAEVEAGCTCPQPEEPRPPCTVHASMGPDGIVVEAIENDPRPNLTERAEAVTAGLMRCPEREDRERECSGWYERGKLTEHMQEKHNGGGGRGRCPYCAYHGPSPLVGAHVAKDHPGRYEEWHSGGQQGM